MQHNKQSSAVTAQLGVELDMLCAVAADEPPGCGLPARLPHPPACLQGGSQPGDFDELGAASRCVVRDLDSKRFFMFYEGVAADGSRSIGLAVSQDGLRGWQRYPQPILGPSSEPGAWDSGSVGTPWAVSMAEGRWRLYYSGRQARAGGGWGGIGLALSTEGALFEGAPSEFRRRAPKE